VRSDHPGVFNAEPFTQFCTFKKLRGCSFAPGSQLLSYLLCAAFLFKKLSSSFIGAAFGLGGTCGICQDCIDDFRIAHQTLLVH
jgi:hypothetical protein